MKSNVFAILLALPMGAMSAAPTTCAMSYHTFDEANKCCKVDSAECEPKTIVTCASGNYQAKSKYGTKKTPDAKTACCAAVATCQDVTCTPGMKKKSSVTGTTKCKGEKAKCEATCCEKDITKCGGNTITCATGMYQDTMKAGTALVNGTLNSVTCCTAQATCDKVSCAPGWKKKSGVGNTTKCDTSAAACKGPGKCCEMDTTTCGGKNDQEAFKCGMNKMFDSSKASTKPTTVDAASCCKDSPHADPCKPAKKGTTSGAQQPQQKAATLFLAITASVAALWA